MVRPLGFEPRTCGLRVRCSAVELEAQWRAVYGSEPGHCRLGVTDGFRTRDPQYHKLMLYQLSYGHHESQQCAIRANDFHHRFCGRRRPNGAGGALVHDGIRRRLGSRERNPEEICHERDGKHSHA